MSDITEEREKEYGDSHGMFACFNDVVSRIDDYRFESRGNWRKTPVDRLVDMVILKVIRLAYNPNHKDSSLDVGGYAKLIQKEQEHG